MNGGPFNGRPVSIHFLFYPLEHFPIFFSLFGDSLRVCAFLLEFYGCYKYTHYTRDIFCVNDSDQDGVHCKNRILYYQSKGHHAPTITKLLAEEGIVVRRKGVHAFFVRVQ
jgi:hypothetical protein